MPWDAHCRQRPPARVRGGNVSQSKVMLLSSFLGGIGTEGKAARTMNATASSGGRNPCRNDGIGDFTSTLGGVLRSLFDM